MSEKIVEFNPKDYKVETTSSWGSIGTIMDAKTLALRVCKELGLNPYGDEIALINSTVGYKIYIKRAGLQKLITPRIQRQYTEIIEIDKNGKDKSIILRVTIETVDGKSMSGLGAADNVYEKALQGNQYTLHKLISIAETRAQMRIMRSLLGEYDVFEDYIEAVPKDSDKVVDLKEIMKEVDADYIKKEQAVKPVIPTKKEIKPIIPPMKLQSFELKKAELIKKAELVTPQPFVESIDDLNDISGLGIDIEDIIRPQIDQIKTPEVILEKISAKKELLDLDLDKLLELKPKPKATPKLTPPPAINQIKQIEKPNWYPYVTEGLQKNKSLPAKQLNEKLFEHYFRGIVVKDDLLITLFDNSYKIGFNDIFAGTKSSLIQFYEAKIQKTVELLKLPPNQFSYLYLPKDDLAGFLSEIFLLFADMLDKHTINDKQFPDYDIVIMLVGPAHAKFFYELFEKMGALK